MTDALLADVAVPLPVDGTLTYSVPNAMLDEVAVGKRVVVPVKSKLLTGIIWKIRSGEKARSGLRPIREIIEPQPVLTRELMKLAEWISGYYAEPLGEVVACMVPPQPGFRNLYRLARDPGGLAMAILKAEEPEKFALLEALKDGKARSTETLRRKTALKGLKAHLEDLVARGYLERQMLLRGRREGKAIRQPRASEIHLERHDLTREQHLAYEVISEAIDGHVFKVFLLHGVTGSGKTEVYLRAIEHAIHLGRKALYLVPEIGLTPQVMQRVRGYFGERCAVLHSQITPAERYRTWRRIRWGEVDVVVGARSAVFAPLDNLGVVVVDEEHDASYKQQETPRYNAREVAIMRARTTNSVAILGSATPSLESYYNATVGKYHLCELSQRISGGELPRVEIIDLKNSEDSSLVTPQVKTEILNSVEKNEQVLLFINRRGYSNYIQCTECGFVGRCRNCNVTLTYHLRAKELRCHYCDYVEPAWPACPKCDGTKITYVGSGTQRIEEWLAKDFPHVLTRRFDRDVTRRRGRAEEVLSDFTSGLVGFLVGTQMVAKGHDFKHVGLVVVVNADVTMNLPDFRSAERTFQILTQVAGRAGRGEVPGRVLIQTFNPDHHSLAYVACHNYRGFYENEILLRKDLSYPPFRRLARVIFLGRRNNEAKDAAHTFAGIARRLASRYPQDFEIVGPARAPLAKIRNVYRWHILIKVAPTKRAGSFIRKCLEKMPSGGHEKIVVDVDPQVLM